MEVNIQIIDKEGIRISEVIADHIVVNNLSDALNLMGESFFNGSSRILIHEKNIIADFFDLKSGLAGEILQKFSTYNLRLAIVGDFSKYKSKSLKDFIFESNKLGRINFVESREEAIRRLSRK